MEFNIELLLKFIAEQNLQYVAIALVIGLFLKVSKMKDKYIPFALMLFNGILITLSNFSLDPSVISDNLAQAILTTGGAVLIHQAYKQRNK